MFTSLAEEKTKKMKFAHSAYLYCVQYVCGAVSAQLQSIFAILDKNLMLQSIVVK